MSNWWHNKRVLITGQTGFKGAWLCLWLAARGAKVTALALPPASEPSLYKLASPWNGQDHHEVDIRDPAALQRIFKKAEPEIVFHMAAQALVRHSYKEPVETYATNVMGTIHIMEAIRQTASVRAAVLLTTDKVYENLETGQAFIEGDRLGGHDPYSNSKACAELAIQCYRDSFFNIPGAAAVASGRAGNVVGGGDWAADRLIPDIVRAYMNETPLNIRYPGAIRPWQHVLDPLHGYMTLARALADNPETTPKAVNFGPRPDSFLSVTEIADIFSQSFGWDLRQETEQEKQPHEAHHLTLDTQLAEKKLGWQPLLSIEETMTWTAKWYRDWMDGADARTLAQKQIDAFEERIEKRKENAA